MYNHWPTVSHIYSTIEVLFNKGYTIYTLLGIRMFVPFKLLAAIYYKLPIDLSFFSSFLIN